MPYKGYAGVISLPLKPTACAVQHNCIPKSDPVTYPDMATAYLMNKELPATSNATVLVIGGLKVEKG